MHSVISTPIVFPKVVPNNWDKWNTIWDKYKNYTPKVHNTKNSGQVHWIGFDIYVKDGVDASELMAYKCENINCPELFNSLFDNIQKLPIDVHVVRVLQSLMLVSAHHDHTNDSNSLRSMLHDDNPKQTWYYEHNNTKEYLRLPEDTNTWWYNDSKTKHGTDYINGYKKQLILYRGITKENEMQSLLEKSMQQYSEYVIYA